MQHLPTPFSTTPTVRLSPYQKSFKSQHAELRGEAARRRVPYRFRVLTTHSLALSGLTYSCPHTSARHGLAP